MSRRHQCRALGLLCAAVAFLAAADASGWPFEGTSLHPGLVYRRLQGLIELPGVGPTRQVVHLLYIDTHHGELSFTATRPDGRGITLSEFAARSGSVAAINTNYFDADRASCGLMVSDGAAWPDAYHHLPWGRCSDSVGFDELNHPSFFDSFERLRGPPPEGVVTAVTGMPRLIQDGSVASAATMRDRAYPPNLRRPNPRTAICRHDDGRTVVLAVVEGRAPGRRGMTGLELARFLRLTVGCLDAVALDGGGSSGLFLDGLPGRPAGVVSRTGPRGERRLCCHLGVRVIPGQAMWRATLADQAPPPIVVAGEPFTLWVRFRNTGRRSWRSSGPSPVALALEPGAGLPSSFHIDPDWPSLTIAALLEQPTAPGEIGCFALRARAPELPGLHTLSLQPVLSANERPLAPPVRWTIDVEPPPRSSDSPADMVGLR